MGLRDLKSKLSQEILGKEVESFSQGVKEFKQQNVERREQWGCIEYGTLASSSFLHPDTAEESMYEWTKKRTKINLITLEYFHGERIYKPPFVEEWLELEDASDEEMEQAIIRYENEHEVSVRRYVERYKNFAQWCDNEEVSDEISNNMLPICFDCGAVIHICHESCPCCGRSFGDEEEESEVCYCSDCGAELDTGARFCQKCGKEIQLSTSFCSGCGTQLDSDSRFCPNCGREVR